MDAAGTAAAGGGQDRSHSFGKDTPPPIPSLLRILTGDQESGHAFAEIGHALAGPGTKVVAVQPAIVSVAAALRRESPHRYLPALTAWQMPAPSVFWTFVRAGFEHGVQGELLPGGLVLLRHVRATPSGHLAGPPAWSMIDLDASRPFVEVDELPSIGRGRHAEADGIWIDWMHSVVSTRRLDQQDIEGEQRRRWFSWLLDDLAVIAVACSGVVTSHIGQLDPDLRVIPKEPTS
jgi:hypothetical protein